MQKRNPDRPEPDIVFDRQVGTEAQFLRHQRNAEFLGLTRHSAVLVCGDTTEHAKPHPAPLLHAAREAGYATDRCVYVGDDLRDIQAAHAAGMPAVAAAYGYLGQDENITTWAAEACVDTPDQLWSAIEPLLPSQAR